MHPGLANYNFRSAAGILSVSGSLPCLFPPMFSQKGGPALVLPTRIQHQLRYGHGMSLVCWIPPSQPPASQLDFCGTDTTPIRSNAAGEKCTKHRTPGCGHRNSLRYLNHIHTYTCYSLDTQSDQYFSQPARWARLQTS